MKLKKLNAQELQQLTTLLSSNLSSRDVSRQLGSRVSKSTINNLRKVLRANTAPPSGPRIMLLDIETTPEISFNWGRWKQYISQEQVIEHPYILTWAVRWLDTGETISRKLTDYNESFLENIKDDRALVRDLWSLLEQADIVVAHNGDKFDIPWVRARAIKYGLKPLNSKKFVDTLKVAKSLVRLPSNSLDSITKYYNLRPKLGNAGFPLWRACMRGDPQAFLDMETYNRGDLDALEDVYLLFRPHMRNHPSVQLYCPDAITRCTRCGSDDVQTEDTVYHTSISSFGTVRCRSCGAVHRTRKNTRSSDQMATTLVGI